ncbi:glutamine synthetase family protein [Umezawaea endophytica]|uniref:Glutamine synthetase family protein n=1 Tax=Umezawaea endophytica TaxID=1654476 RepID=A0A9X2VKM2_9PSEU|nr:glutamine synthetase family protein [Umezawaea endophytica]MCS7478370.1 glutamine synthetase family protein [Umezawaea endophytica]
MDTAHLEELGVVAVAVTWVDNSGVTRVKSVPLKELGGAVGASPSFDVFLLQDSIIDGRFVGGPVGDLRLHPDLSRLTALAAQPGWAWAPADRYHQDGRPYALDQRLAAKAAVERLADAGFAAEAGFELEWVVGKGGTDDFVPATTGPAYGHARQVELSDYCAEVIRALVAQDVRVVQFHPEYAASQFEVSTAPSDPVAAADTAVLVRETIRAVTVRHGMRASFSPKVMADGVGNGGHLHLSLWRDGRNLFTGGEGRFGLSREAERFTAGVLEHLPALTAIGSPSVASYLRLVPSHWSAPYAAWGLENRETALRLVSGANANLEVKSFDLSANPYLVIASVLSAGLAGGGELPDPLDVDPARLPDVPRLPSSLKESADALESDQVLNDALGRELVATIVDVRRGEVELFADSTPEEVVAVTRWQH